MKLRILAGFVFLQLLLCTASANETNWKGWITDSHCGASGAHPGDAACARSCVKKGAKFVFVDDTNKKVYLLDPQDRVEPHAGEHVVIKGSLDGRTLRFTSIGPLQ
jgi:hypothetical protein